MRYYNTNNPTEFATLEQAVMQGRAHDGGLFMPEHIPQLPKAFINNMSMMTLQEISYAVANFALQGAVDSEMLKEIIDDIVNGIAPVVDSIQRKYGEG